MRYIRYITLSLALMFFANSYAASDNKTKINPVLAAGLFEGLAAVNAKLASTNPHAYGVFGALLFPVGMTTTNNNATLWATLVSAESIAIYNIRIDENKTTQSEIFRKNMIGWNLFAGVVGLTYWLTDDSENNDKVSLAFMPTPDGGELGYTYRF